MCGGGTLPLLATASINANCPWVSSPVARKVINEPLYQTERSRDCRPLLNPMDSVGFLFVAPGASPEELISRSMVCCVISLLSFTDHYCRALDHATLEWTQRRHSWIPQ